MTPESALVGGVLVGVEGMLVVPEREFMFLMASMMVGCFVLPRGVRVVEPSGLGLDGVEAKSLMRNLVMTLEVWKRPRPFLAAPWVREFQSRVLPAVGLNAVDPVSFPSMTRSSAGCSQSSGVFRGPAMRWGEGVMLSDLWTVAALSAIAASTVDWSMGEIISSEMSEDGGSMSNVVSVAAVAAAAVVMKRAREEGGMFMVGVLDWKTFVWRVRRNTCSRAEYTKLSISKMRRAN